jgi:hypothetical protein
MKPKRISREKQGNFLYPELMDQLNPKDPLLVLGKKIPWKKIDRTFTFFSLQHDSLSIKSAY